MRGQQRIGVVIPALNEERAIGKVVAAIPDWVDLIVVADNGSNDRTMAVAKAAGARVVQEPERGYGAACLRALAELHDFDVIVFVDGDFADDPSEMPLLVDPILAGEADLVIGSRRLGEAERGALTPQQMFGNWLACHLIALIWGVRFTDLGPFRAISGPTLRALEMRDRNYGWTVEMQIKAARDKLKVREVPVSYRRRIGTSKVSGTLKGTVLAGVKILGLIGLFALKERLNRRPKS